MNVEEIKNKYVKMYRKNIYLFDYPKEVVIEKKILSSLQVLNTDKKFLDINEEIFSVKYDCSICRDIVQHMYKTMALSYNIPLEQIMSRYSDTYEDVEERIMFRIELYKHGWTIEQIENYIFQYLLKQEFKIDNIDRVYKKYHNFMVKRDIMNKEIAKKVGRPSLPKVLKQYLKMKHLENVKLLMRDKYESSKKYKDIISHMLTKDEIKLILDKIDEPKIREKLEWQYKML